MMSYEDFVAKAAQIDIKHKNDRESSSHIDDLLMLYKEYGNAANVEEQSNSGEQLGSVSGNSGERNGEDRGNVSDKA